MVRHRNPDAFESMSVSNFFDDFMNWLSPNTAYA
jgi:hypothetical protein